MGSRLSRGATLGAIAGLVGTLAVYFVLREALGNSTTALAITDAIPMLWVIVIAIARRRIDPVALLVVVGFAVALGITVATGGSSLPLKLRRALFPGAAGLACLISVAVRRPLLTIAATRMAQARAQAGNPATDEARRKSAAILQGATVLTAIIGFILVADAAAQIALALTVSTSAFVGLARIASYTIIGAGLAVCALYVHWLRAHPTQPEAKRPVSRPT